MEGGFGGGGRGRFQEGRGGRGGRGRGGGGGENAPTLGLGGMPGMVMPGMVMPGMVMPGMAMPGMGMPGLGMQGLPGMQGVAMMQQAPTSLPAGPTHPIIFAGHVGKDPSSQNTEEDEEEDEGEESEGKESESGQGEDAEQANGKAKGESSAAMNKVYEINLNQQAHFLEGIHIVPMGVSPPVGFPFEGKTRPDRSVRPFRFELYARDIDTDVVRLVLTNTIHGGVQWLEVPAPLNRYAFDYLAIRGDFEVMSLLVHGGAIETSVLKEEAVKIMENGMPIPPGFVSSDADAADDAEYDSDEDGDGAGERTTGDRMAQLPMPSSNIIEALSHPVNTLSASLKRRQLTPCDHLLKSFLNKGCALSPYCLVSISSVAGLVDAIFSVEPQKFSTLPIDERISTLTSITRAMSECLSSSSNCSSSNSSSSNSSSSSSSSSSSASNNGSSAGSDEFAVALGEDAVGIMISLVVTALDGLSLDGSGAATSSADGSSEISPEFFLMSCTAVLDVCKVIAINEFTAKALQAAGGITRLATIASQKPSLPPRLQASLLAVICRAVKHLDIAVPFIAPSSGGDSSNLDVDDFFGGDVATPSLSGYQLILNACTSEVLTRPPLAAGREALNWCALVEACSRMRRFSTLVFESLGHISQSVAWHVSAVSSAGSAAEAADSESYGEKDSVADKISAELIASSTQMHALYLECNESVAIWLTSLASCMGLIAEKERMTGQDAMIEAGCDRAALVKLLHEANVIGHGLVAVCALACALEEFSALSDWSWPHSESMKASATHCHSLAASVIGNILSMPHGELVVGMHTEEAQLLWRYVSQDEHVFATQSLEELLELAKEADTMQAPRLAASSYGWIVFLLCSAMGATQRFILGDNKAVLELQELACFPTGASVVALSVQSCLPNLLQLLQTDEPGAQSVRIAALEILRAALESDIAGVGKSIRKLWMDFPAVLGLLSAASDEQSSEAAKVLAISQFASYNGQSDLLATLHTCRRDVCAARATIATQRLPGVLSLEAPMRLLAQASEIDFTEAAMHNDADGLLAGAVAVLNASTQYARGGVGWAAEQSVSTRGYSESYFEDFLRYPTSQTASDSEPMAVDEDEVAVNRNNNSASESKVDDKAPEISVQSKREGVDKLLSDASAVLRTLLSSLQLIDVLLNTMRTQATTGNDESKAAGLQSEALLTALLEAHSLAHSLLGPSRTGRNGSFARRISAVVVRIVRLYCPPSPWALHVSLVPFLVSRAIQVPRLMQSNMALIAELVPSSVLGGFLDMCLQSSLSLGEGSGVSGRSIMDGASSKDRAVDCATARTHRQLEALALHLEHAGSQRADSEARYLHAVEDSLVADWGAFLSRGPIIAGNSVAPFAYTSSNASSTQKKEWTDNSTDPDLIVKQALEGRCDLPALIMSALYSVSQEIHLQAYCLCQKALCLGAGGVGRDISNALVRSLDNMALLQVHLSPLSLQAAADVAKTEAGSSNSSSKQKSAQSGTSYETISAQCRLLLLVHDICSSDAPCLQLVAQGLLSPIITLLHSSHHEVVTLALQAVSTVYRVLSRIAARLGQGQDEMDIEADENEYLAGVSPKEMMHGELAVTLQAIAECVVSLLPAIAMRFQSSSLVTAQVLFTINALPLRYFKAFLDFLSSTSSATSLEVLSIKAWLFFEDAFQHFSELTEAVKSARGSPAELQEFFGDDNGVEVLAAAHSQLAAAASALSTVLELVCMAYQRGWISLFTLNRAMRTAIAEPRKVSLRYQRAYTMWSTERKHAYSRPELSSKELLNEHPLPPVNLSSVISRLDDDRSIDFESRHALVFSSMRQIAESCRKHYEWSKSEIVRDDKGGALESLQLSQVPQVQNIDFAQPFTSSELLQKWFALKTLETRASSSSRSDIDALHSALRRVFITGDASRCSVFDYSENYIRLLTLPALVDPGAMKRRTQRRQKRRADRKAAAREAALLAAEAAKKVAAEAEEKRLQMEREAAALEAKKAQEHHQQVLAQQQHLPGVPKQLHSTFTSQHQQLPPQPPQAPQAPKPPQQQRQFNQPPPHFQQQLPPPPQQHYPGGPPMPGALSSAAGLPPPPGGGLHGLLPPPPPMAPLNPAAAQAQALLLQAKPPVPQHGAGRGRSATLPSWMTGQ